MNIIGRLNSIKNLPTLPEVVQKVQRMVFSDDGSAQGLAKIVEQDPSLAAKILQVANSGLYATGARITSVPTAITRLGFNEIGQIVMAASVVKNFSRTSDILDYKQFWRHALTAAHMAFTASQISRVGMSREERDALYLAGLLHDIGILIYDQFFHEEFEAIVDYAEGKGIPYIEAETAIAPKETHAALGAALLEMWKVGSAAIDGVRFHHAPDRAPDKQKSISFIIHLSEYILCNSGLGSFEGLMRGQSGNILAQLKIDPDRLPAFLHDAQAEVDKSDLILAIEKPEPEKPRGHDWLLRSV
ncbi:MAG: HDOD domain-containing protein [Chitinispirillales bacterium]|jgi:HD-like signal output (HDOD) protein|nr:HDOD domain-containing protein [Chitinispirillales bacterium]